MLELNESNFESTVNAQGIVLVDLWASWCMPCRMFAPVFAAAEKRHLDVTFAKVDTEAAPTLAGELGVQAIPTLMAFRDGVLVFEQAGALPSEALERLIAAVRGLDMKKVLAQATATVSGAGR